MPISTPQPTVSVVIPTFNRARTVTKAIASVLRQSYPNYEIVVVDDGSTDDTPTALARYRGQVTYIRQENKGRSAARNRGLQHSSHPYIVFLDSDDVLLPNMLAVQTAYLERHPEVAFVHGHALMADLDGRVLKPPVLMGAPLDSHQSAFASLLMGTSVLIHTTLVRQSCLDDVGGFDETLSGNEDWDLWLRLAARYPVGFNPEPVAVYCVDVTDNTPKLDQYQVQKTIPQMIERAFTYLSADSPLMELKPRAIARAHVQWGACVEYALGKSDQALTHIREALAAYPTMESDIEVVPKGVARFATWYQRDGQAFIRSFFRDVPPLVKDWKQMERSALVLYHLKEAQLAAYQQRYVSAARHALRAAVTQPVALGWASRQFARRVWNQMKDH